MLFRSETLAQSPVAVERHSLLIPADLRDIEQQPVAFRGPASDWMASDDGGDHLHQRAGRGIAEVPQAASMRRKRRRDGDSGGTSTPASGHSGEAATLASGESTRSTQVQVVGSTAAGRRQLGSSQIRF